VEDVKNNHSTTSLASPATDVIVHLSRKTNNVSSQRPLQLSFLTYEEFNRVEQ